MWCLKAQQQIEYYFSDRNLQKDTFLLSKTGPSGTHFVALECLCTFNRLKTLGSDSGLSVKELVQAAAEHSSDLELSSDRLSLRRWKPLPPNALEAQAQSVGTVLIGSEPNVYWYFVSMDELRSQERFLALPPPSSLEIHGPATWSWVRQDNPLWEQLHWGVLSTRHLKGILGFQEPQAAAFLGLAHNMIDHDEVLSAYHDLLEAPEASAYHTHHHADINAQAKNKRRRQEFNDNLVRSISGRSKSMRRCGKFTSLSQVRCAWGSAQEAAALQQLLDAQEIVAAGGVLEEVGLCMLDPEELTKRQGDALMPTSSSNQKIRRWGSKSPSKASRPSAVAYPSLMGASPDAMLRFPDEERVGVKVKNVCPFFDHNGLFAVHDSHVNPDDRNTVPHWWMRGPAESLPTAYAPQAQWEMFVANVQRNYFVSASALQGINVRTG